MTVAFDLILARPWAIAPSWLDTMLAIAAREGDPQRAIAEREQRTQRREAVYAYATKPMDGTRGVRLRETTALVEINGPIFRYASMFEDISGGTSVQHLARDIQAALDNPAITALVLVIDSPGGEVDGIHALAQMIYAARGSKPITAYVDGDGCSAAYWLASAADEIVIDATARLGSIGVRMSMRDPSSARAGTLWLVDSSADLKDPDPNTADGRGELVRQVNSLAAVFRADVCAMRGCTEERITSLRGGVRIGQEAVDAGLADRLGSLEAVIQSLDQSRRSPGATLAMEDGMTDEELRTSLVAATPDAATALLDANKIKAEVLAEVQTKFDAQAALITTQNEQLTAFAGQFAALTARLNTLDDSQPVNSGYRASLVGPAPSVELAAQVPQLTKLDTFLDGE